MFLRSVSLLALCASASQIAWAQDPLQTDDAPRILDALTIVGVAGGADEVAGSIAFLSEDALEVQNHSDVLRILRTVPGVNIQEEEGYGLRPNIGLRGSGADRNSRIAVLEDGVPIAPAAYASPSAYYFPSAGRIESIEVTKGPAVIQYGPRTTGGAVHLFSTRIPTETAGKAEYLLGSHGRQRLHAHAGTRADLGQSRLQAGLLVETYQDRADGFLERDGGGDTGFDVSDYVIKAGLYSESSAMPWSLELKYQTREETSEQTYLGLTDADFAANPYRLYAASANDVMNNENELFQLTGKVDFTGTTSLTLMAYSNEFARNWYKLHGVNADGNGASGDVGLSSILEDPLTFADELNLLTGATSLDDSIVVRANNRKYYSRGLQGVLDTEWVIGNITHNILVGARYHEDEEDRFQKEDAYRLAGGALALTTGGAAGSQANRVSTGDALALYVLDQIEVTNRLKITGGLRFEDYTLVRDDFSTADAARADGPTRTRENSRDVVLPSLSALYDVSDAWTILGGVHQGFAIASPGNSTSDPEESWNYEAGARYAADALSFEAIAYFNDYSNLLGDCTGSSGGGCVIGDQFDGGEVDVRGLEVTASWDAANALGQAAIDIPLSLTYTFTDAEFQTGFNSDYGPWGNVEAGDELPYVAHHQMTLGAGIVSNRWSLNTSASYVGEARATAGHGSIAASDTIDSRWVVDMSASYEVAGNIFLKAKAENLFDEVYIAARRPSGVRPGKPQEFLVGVEVKF